MVECETWAISVFVCVCVLLYSFSGCFLYLVVKEVVVVNGVDGLLFRCFIDMFMDRGGSKSGSTNIHSGNMFHK